MSAPCWLPLEPPSPTESRHGYFSKLHDAIHELRDRIDALPPEQRAALDAPAPAAADGTDPAEAAPEPAKRTRSK